MENNDPAKEWGLPDWRNADSYTNAFGRPDEWSDDRLRWEFKRRQPEYRRAFDDLVRAGKHGIRPAGGDDQREKFGNSYIRTLTETALNDEANKAGFMFRADEDLAFLHQMFFLPNPRFSDQPSSSLLFANSVQVAKKTAFGGKKHVYPYHFDISQPLTPQLNECREYLEMVSSLMGMKAKRQNAQKGKFLEYLRLLDAKECGASLQEMSIILKNKRKTPQSARDSLKAARAMRNKS